MTLRLLLLALCLGSPVLAEVETWTDQRGRAIQAELLNVGDDFVVLRNERDGRRYRVPLDTLSEADQKRARAAAAQFAEQREERRRNPAAPSRETPDPAKASPSAQPDKTKAAAPASAPAPSQPKAANDAPRLPATTQNLSEIVVTLKDNAFVPVSAETLTPLKYYALYFAAGWSGASRQFTPELVAAYPKIKAAHPEFELVFVSYDESEPEMISFMTEEKMPWPAVKHDALKNSSFLRRHRGKGVPNLVFLNANGKVLSSSYIKVKAPETPAPETPAANPPPATTPATASPQTPPDAQNAKADAPKNTAPKETDVYEGPHKVLTFLRDYLDNPPPPPKPARRPASGAEKSKPKTTGK